MEKRPISTYLETKPIHIEVLSTSYCALDNYIDDQDYATQVEYGSIRLKGGLVNSRVREWWSGLSVDPYSPGNEGKKLRTSDVETTIDDVTQQNQQTLLSCPLLTIPSLNDPRTRYSHEVHGLILVPVTGDGLFRRIGTFVKLRYLSYPK